MLKSLSSCEFNALVIGGRITGASVVFDAASQSLSVTRVESQDFVSGKSSRSIKLTLGGFAGEYKTPKETMDNIAKQVNKIVKG